MDAAGEQILLHPGYETLVMKGGAPTADAHERQHACLNQILNLISRSAVRSTVVEGARSDQLARRAAHDRCRQVDDCSRRIARSNPRR